MAVKYFRDMPTIKYDIDGTGNSKEAVDILRGVKFRSELTSVVGNYYMESLSSSQRPEVLSNEVYSNPESHWILMMANGVHDPMYDWYIDPRTLDKIIDKKYPNRVIQLPSDYYRTNTSDKKIFHVGEDLREDVFPASSGISAGNILGFDADLRQIVVKSIPEWAIGADIEGQESGAIFEWTTSIKDAIVNQRDAIRHYEKPMVDGNGSTVGSGIVVGSTYPNAVAITNAEYEINENDKKREVKIIGRNYLPGIEEDYIKKIVK